MLKVLLKKQLHELFRTFFQNRKTGKARSRAAAMGSLVLFAVLMVCVLGGCFAYMAFMLRPLVAAGFAWLYFLIFGMIGIALGTFGSVFNTYASVYQASDNDLLLSLPIPARLIVAVRLIGVYLMGLLYSAVALIPAVIVYAFSGAGVGAVLGSAVFVLLVSVLVCVLSCALGYLVARISAKIRMKSLVTVLASLTFIAVYYYVYFKAATALNTLLSSSALYAEKIRGSAWPLYFIGRAGAGEGLPLLALAAITAALAALTLWLIVRSFLRLSTGSAGTVRREAGLDRLRVRSVPGALFAREMRHLLASPPYLLNCALGVVFLLIAGVALLLRGDVLRELFSLMPSLRAGAAALVGFAVCLVAGMNDLTAPSISLEGQSLWIVQSLPVTAWQVLRAKLYLHLALTVPPLAFCMICAAVALRFSLAEAGCMLLLGLLCVAFNALTGLTVNLRLPNLNWTSETVAVKQGFAVLLSLLIGWVVVIAMGAAAYFLGGFSHPCLTLTLCAAALALADAGLLLYVKNRGAAAFARL